MVSSVVIACEMTNTKALLPEAFPSWGVALHVVVVASVPRAYFCIYGFEASALCMLRFESHDHLDAVNIVPGLRNRRLCR